MHVKVFAFEFIGTMTLIFVGAGTDAVGVGGLVGVALAHSLVIIGFAYATGNVSGTHLNPAVTFGLAIAGAIEWLVSIQNNVARP